MKNDLKQKAIDMRRNGVSIIKIAKILGVSKSSISTWTRDVLLTEEQRKSLSHRDNSARSIAISNTSRIRREQFQNKGRNRIKTVDEIGALYVAGCMLYWGEGAKDINQVSICNSDVNVLILFKRFLIECFHIKSDDLKLIINCHTDLRSKEEIESYWLSKLNLSKCCLGKTTVSAESDKRKANTSFKKKKLEYGVATLRISKTEIVQEIYGAIQEFGSFKNDKWLNH